MSGAVADPGSFLRDLFAAAVAAADPLVCLPPCLPPPLDSGRTCIIAIGKAAAGMALAARRTYAAPSTGLVVVRRGMPVDTAALGPGFEVIEAAHPVLDAASERAGRRALDLASALCAQDRLLALISGGGSALAEVPVAGVSLADIQALTAGLLASGAPIGEINAVRRALSHFKGGGLAAAAWPAQVVTCIISDVPGDDPGAVASGPTVPPSVSPPASPSVPASVSSGPEALQALDRYRITAPPAVLAALAGQSCDRRDTRPAPDTTSPVICVASGATALAAAAGLAGRHGVLVRNLGDRLQGEARELGRDHARLARTVAAWGGAAPRLILSGGESTVTLAGPQRPGQRGGRNLAYLLALAIELDGAAGIHAIACDSDGLDGSSPAAGAVIDPTTLARARAIGLDPAACLDGHQSHRFFKALGDLVITGQTGTNINDVRAILIQPGS